MLLFGRRWTQKIQKQRRNQGKCRFHWTLMDVLGSPWICRLRDYSALRASPLRGRRRRRRRSTLPSGEVVEPACCLSGVRMEARKRWKPRCVFQNSKRVCRLRDYSALRASPLRGRRRRRPRSTSPGGEVVEPACLSVGGSNGRPRAVETWRGLPKLLWGFAG
jgi:hypothetical protein